LQQKRGLHPDKTKHRNSRYKIKCPGFTSLGFLPDTFANVGTAGFLYVKQAGKISELGLCVEEE
jgi:hypothetical protein